MQCLVIDSTQIQRDAEGRYSLNDLHRAAGGEARHQPSNWLRTQQAQALIAEVSAGEIPQIRGIDSRKGLGTFVVKELVYAYAMWISAAFSLRVIHAYDLLMTGESKLSLQFLDPEFRAGRSIAETAGLKGNQATLAGARAVHRLHGVDPLEVIGEKHLLAHEQVRHFTPTELGERLGLSARKFNVLLAERGLQEKRSEAWVPTPAGEPFAVLLDTGKWHHDGTPVQQLKWLESVLPMVTPPVAA